MGAKRKICTQYRTDAAHLVIDTGRTIAAVADEIGVGAQLLGRWVAQERVRMDDPTSARNCSSSPWPPVRAGCTCAPCGTGVHAGCSAMRSVRRASQHPATSRHTHAAPGNSRGRVQFLMPAQAISWRTCGPIGRGRRDFLSPSHPSTPLAAPRPSAIAHTISD